MIIVDLLHESLNETVATVGDAGIIKMKGIFLQSNKVNGNGRVYEKSWFKKAVDEYIRDFINTGKALGELDHPDYLDVDINEMTHKIISLTEVGDDWHGELEVLHVPSDPKYQRIKACVMQGVPLGVSSRAVGRTENIDGIDYVVEEGFRFGTVADIVLNPSAPDAWISAINERKQYIWDGDTLHERKMYAAKGIIDASAGQSVGDIEQKLINHFLKHNIT